MPLSTQVKRFSGASQDSDDTGRSDDDSQQQQRQRQRRRQPQAVTTPSRGILRSPNIYLPTRHRSSSVGSSNGDSEGKQEDEHDDGDLYHGNDNDNDGHDDGDDEDIESGGGGPPSTIIPRRRRTRFSIESLLSRVTEDDDDDTRRSADRDEDYDDRAGSNASPLAAFSNANAGFRHSLRASQRSSLRSEQSSEGSSSNYGEAASGSASATAGSAATTTTREQQQQQQQQQSQPRPRKISFAAKFLPRLSYESAAGSLDDSSSNTGVSCTPQHNNNSNNSNSSYNPHNNPLSNAPPNHSPYHHQLSATSLATRKYRRYSVREYVLISNHNCLHPHKLVNLHGYPSWWWTPHLGGRGNPSLFSKSSPERRGPYCYLLAQVVSVHFEEDAQYYTVMREDDRERQRADAEWMEPIKEPEGLEAAKTAARRRDDVADARRNEAKRPFRRRGGMIGALASLCCCGWMEEEGYSVRRRAGSSKCGVMVKRVLRWVRREADRCLNGQRPYGMEVRVTGVNLLVGCGLWYLFVDQLRLAFFPHSADFALAVVSCIVWLILFFELLFEIFIRPDKYHALVRSDKAYLPSTVRYLSTIQFFLELIPLAFFIPEFMCIFDSHSCGSRRAVSLATCSIMSVYGPTRLDAFYGRAFLCIMRLRIFGLVRHWKKMWVNNTFVMKKSKTGEWRIERGRGLFVPQGHRNWGIRAEASVIPLEESYHYKSAKWLKSKKDVGASVEEGKGGMNGTSTDDYHLTNASNIGTALLTTNTERGLLLVFFIGLSSLIRVTCMEYGGTNHQLVSSVEFLQANNLAADNTRNETCDFFRDTVFQWVASNIYDGGSDIMHLLHLEIEPVRCDFQKGPDGSQSNGVMGAALCGSSEALARCETLFSKRDCNHLCKVWSASDEQERQYYYENLFGIRPSVTFSTTDGSYGTYSSPDGEIVNDYFSVSAVFNETKAVSQSIITLFLSQLGFTLFVLLSLSVLRYDAGRLVLGPLRRMLKIVAFYAKNPLSPSPTRESTGSLRSSSQNQDDDDYDSEDENNSDKQLGTYETEQLINTVTKITDLLRKCWGVAGAGIISSNLARQEGGLTTLFNPTVPGEAVYALFAFVAIDKFQHHLHCLKGDIMILINDIAAVLHEEVYRWGYEDRGQCNKNLGGAFLMVYRIGTVAEVLEKRDRAEAVIFSAKGKQGTMRNRRRSGQLTSHTRTSSSDSRNGRSVDSIDLSSLPGIRSFTDRAILGLLKTFAGIHRDATLLKWQSDFRLGAGVHATSIELIFGMDAGWAVEGAVGSSYKIDATYLSPHVNMASRMMSATKQYGVFFLFSQAVQGLLSDNAKDKLRHIDTVTVKGSSVQQKIFTYDAKVRSDFFLYSKTEDQADLDSERYSPAIWDTDQDIVAMRNHIDDDFIRVFNRGRDEYLAGNWPKAISLLKKADRIMFDREVDEGYVSHVPSDNMRSLSNVLDSSDIYDDEYYPEEGEDKVTRLALGDGPCQRLIAYMSEMGGEAPDNWAGYRPLTSK